MSQSDRVQYRKLAEQLKIAKFNPVFDSGDYTSFKSFGLVNNQKKIVLNSNDLVEYDPKILEYYSVPLNNVYDSSGNISCPNYLCKNYQQWPNRVPLAGIYSSPAPQNYFYWEKFNVCIGDIQGTIKKYSYNNPSGCEVRQVTRTKDTAMPAGTFYKNY